MVMLLQMVMVMVFTRMMLTVCWLQTAPLCLDFNFLVILSIFLFLWLLFFCLQMTPLCSTIELGISRSSQIWKIGAISQFAWDFAFSLAIHNSFDNEMFLTIEMFQLLFELFPPIVLFLTIKLFPPIVMFLTIGMFLSIEMFQLLFELFPPIVMSSSCQRRGF